MATTPNPLHFPSALRALIDPYLLPSSLTPLQSIPTTPQPNPPHPNRPHLTLTYASSLDACLSLSQSTPTALSGPASKAMTHYLRTRHDAILIGSGTAISDDPTLNSRLVNGEGEMVGLDMQPRPVVLDRRGRWDVRESSRVIEAAKGKRGKGPWVLVSRGNVGAIGEKRRKLVEHCGGAVVECEEGFEDMLAMLWDKGVRSVMVEGGCQVINNLLSKHADLIDALIVTLAPVYFGNGGVGIQPQRREGKRDMPSVELKDVRWLPLDRDVVMCGRIEKRSP